MERSGRYRAQPNGRDVPIGAQNQTSIANTANKTVCRICLESNGEYDLICPCNCKGTVGYIHAACLHRWVDITHNTMCQICASEYELESFAWKPLSEWSFPKPISEAYEDQLDFHFAIAWIVFFSRFIYMQLRYGTEETKRNITESIGTGVYATFWWFAFWMNLAYYGSIIILIMSQWLSAHRVYRFRNRIQ